MDGLKLIDIALKNSRKEIEERARVERIREEQEKKSIRELLTKEEPLFSKRKEYHDKIFEWRDWFVKTDQFNQISELMSKNPGISNLTIFHNGWGHVIPCRKKQGCWSHLELNKEGNIIYFSGYKYMGIKNLIDLLGNQDKFSPLYLKEVVEEIDEGEIYNTIALDIEKKGKYIR